MSLNLDIKFNMHIVYRMCVLLYIRIFQHVVIQVSICALLKKKLENSVAVHAVMMHDVF